MGGYDVPENINKAFRRALRLNWKSYNKCIIHIGDAPCHGKDFHKPGLPDKYPEGYNTTGKDNFMPWNKIFYQLKNIGIDYFFLQIDSRTKQMTDEFKHIWQDTPIHTLIHRDPIYECKQLNENIMEFTDILSEMILSSYTQSFSNFNFSSLNTFEQKEVRAQIQNNQKNSSRQEPEIFQQLDYDQYKNLHSKANFYPVWDKNDHKFWNCKIQDEGKIYTTKYNIDLQNALNIQNIKINNQQKIKLTFHKTPFARGGFNIAYYCMDHMDNKLVMKRAIHNLMDSDYIKEMKKNSLCELFADQYNKELEKAQLSFIKIHYMSTFVVKSSDNAYFMIEGYIPGDYQKISNNWIYYNNLIDTRVFTAFSHFTHQYSNHKYMVTDIQGVDCFITDPIIHSKYYEFSGLGDLGLKGMYMFFMKHRCNEICKALKLIPNKFQEKYQEIIVIEKNTPLEQIKKINFSKKKCQNRFCNYEKDPNLSQFCQDCFQKYMKYNQIENQINVDCEKCGKTFSYNQFEIYAFLKNIPTCHQDIDKDC